MVLGLRGKESKSTSGMRRALYVLSNFRGRKLIRGSTGPSQEGKAHRIRTGAGCDLTALP